MSWAESLINISTNEGEVLQKMLAENVDPRTTGAEEVVGAEAAEPSAPTADAHNAWDATLDRMSLAEYLDTIIAVLPDTGYERVAQEWKADPAPAGKG